MYRVLVTSHEVMKEYPEAFRLLEREGCELVKSPSPPPVKEKDLLEIIGDFDAIITGGDEVTAQVIEAADKLKVIAKCGVGVEKIDINAATSRKIPVAIAPNQNAVADLTFALMLCLARRICEANALVRSGGWRKIVGTELWQATLGVVGAGRIGQAVIKRARGFDMKVLVYDVCRDEQTARALEFEYMSLEGVLRESDFVTLHCPLNDTTRGLLSKKRLALMKPSAYLINTARAQIVDEEALCKALRDRRIAGAALDVYSEVPPPKNSPFFALDNVITTPWIGSDTRKTMNNVCLITAKNILRVLRGQRPLYVVPESSGLR